jgi:hypothetical protein
MLIVALLRKAVDIDAGWEGTVDEDPLRANILAIGWTLPA